MGIEINREAYLSILARAIKVYRQRVNENAQNLGDPTDTTKLLPASYYHHEFIVNEKRARQLEQILNRTRQEESFVLCDLNVIDLINNSGVAQL